MSITRVSRDLWLPDRALRYGVNTTDVTTITTAASLDDQDPVSYALWYRLRAYGDLARIWDKGPKIHRQVGTTPIWNLFITRATTSTEYRIGVAGGTLPGMDYSLNQWMFMGMSYSSAGGTSLKMHFWQGLLDGSFREIAHAVVAEGAGGNNTDAASNISIGNNAALTRDCDMDCAFFAQYNREMGDEFEGVFREGSKFGNPAVAVLLGDNGDGATQLDISGNGLTITNSGPLLCSGPAAFYSKSAGDDKDDPPVEIAGWAQLQGLRRNRLVNVT